MKRHFELKLPGDAGQYQGCWVHYTPGSWTNMYWYATAAKIVQPGTICEEDLILTAALHRTMFNQVMEQIQIDEEDLAIEYEFEARAEACGW